MNNVAKLFVGDGEIIIQGDLANRSNVLLTSATGYNFTHSTRCNYRLKSLKLTNTNAATSFAVLATGSTITIDAVEFGAMTNGFHIVTDTGAIVLLNNYSITGGAVFHLYAQKSTCVNMQSAATVTGTPNFSNTFAFLTTGAIFDWVGFSYSGAATGKRHDINRTAVAATGTNASYFPGNVSGTTTTGGILD